jgi:XTP/dITP diphosphohydrolase
MIQIRSPQDRSARFVCTIVAYSPLGEESVIEGVLNGQIALQARGTTGFGYDAIFTPEGEQQTLAEIGARKNLISHRAQAVNKLQVALLSLANSGKV